MPMLAGRVCGYNRSMRKLVSQQVVHAWIAMLSVLFSALAPTISHAMAPVVEASEEVQVCTAQGMKTVVLAKAPSKSPGSADHLFNHCPYCTTHGNAGSVPPTAPFVVVLLGMDSSHPPLF